MDVPLTSNRAVEQAVDNLRPGGYTDIAASLNQAIDQLLLPTGPEPKVVLLLTDGRTNTVNGKYLGDNNPKAVDALLQAADRAYKKSVTVYGINYGVPMSITI